MDSKEEILSELIDNIGYKIKSKINFCQDDNCPDLSLRDLAIIDFVGKEKKTMTDISEKLNLCASTTTPIIDKLISQKLLKRERCENIDRRKVFISLGTNGINICQKHKKAKLLVSKLMLNGFNESEKEELINIMNKISQNLEK